MRSFHMYRIPRSNARSRRNRSLVLANLESRTPATPIKSITSTLLKHRHPQPKQNKPLAHSFKNIGGIPLSPSQNLSRRTGCLGLGLGLAAGLGLGGGRGVGGWRE